MISKNALSILGISVLLSFMSLGTEIPRFSQVHNGNEVKEQWYNYYPSVVSLTGTLKEKWHYGPPNYGENPKTDKILYYYVLELENPINVRQDTSKDIFCVTYRNIRTVELVIGDQLWRSLGERIGHKVTLRGRLMPKTFAHDFTNVLLQVNVPNEETFESDSAKF